MSGPIRCPCCQQTIQPPRKAARICYDCGNPILRGHRFTFSDRRGETAIVHRVCCNPEGYYRAGRCKEAGVVGYNNLTQAEVDMLTANEDMLEAKFAQWRLDNGKA